MMQDGIEVKLPEVMSTDAVQILAYQSYEEIFSEHFLRLYSPSQHEQRHIREHLAGAGSDMVVDARGVVNHSIVHARPISDRQEYLYTEPSVRIFHCLQHVCLLSASDHIGSLQIILPCSLRLQPSDCHLHMS